MTVEEARDHAARVLRKAEKVTDPSLMAELVSAANTWLRLAQDVQWYESEKTNDE